MKYLFLTNLLLILNLAFSQVGINTTDPQETLDVNGTSKFRTTNQPSITTVKICGLDANGVLREIFIGTNLQLNNNTLNSASNTKYSFGAVTIDDNINNTPDNVDLLIGPGEVNEDKIILRINVADNLGDLKFTGLKAGTDGQHVWLYPQHGSLELLKNDANSLSQNQIEDNTLLKAQQFNMIELVYDATKSKWIVMYHN